MGVGGGLRGVCVHVCVCVDFSVRFSSVLECFLMHSLP